MKRVLIIVCCLVFISKSFSQVIEQDSLALISLYKNLNGPEWFNNMHWLEESYSVSRWYGVEVRNSRVVELDLAGNNLNGNIPTEIGDLDSLSILNLSYNEICSMPSDISKLLTLDTLSLGGCPVCSIPSEMGQLRDLKLLSLSYSEIKTLPDELGELYKLKYLYANNSLIENIPETIGGLTSIEIIYLEINEITNLPASIGNCLNLKELYLNSNKIPEVPVGIGNLENLEKLVLGKNCLESIPNEVYNLTNLKMLNYAVNKLDSISPLIGNLDKLENFQIFDCEFTYLPEEIGNCTKLNQLYAYGNNLDRLPHSMLDLINLNTLNVSYNALTFGDIEPFVTIPGISYFYQDSIGTRIDTTAILDSGFYMEVLTDGDYNQYQWKKNNEVIEGATDPYLGFSSLNYADSGSYVCEITSTIATELTLYTQPIVLSVIDNTAIEEDIISYEELFKLYSGQEQNYFQIEIPVAMLCDKPHVEIYSINGHWIKSFNLVDRIKYFDLSGNKRGVYLALFYIDNCKVADRKFVF